MPLLQINRLRSQFFIGTKTYTAVDGISFEIEPGETLCIVGESGSGKSVTALSILKLVTEPGRITGGEILLNEQDLLTLPENELRKLRGNKIAMIFQEPMTALNPVLTCGEQVREVIILHQNKTRDEANRHVVELFQQVGLPDAKKKLRSYPHELSGGMRQRVMIAMALACRPSLLIADEPTTALDVTVQAQILEILKTRQRETGMSILLITHDFGIVAETADRVAVMYAGRIVETGPVRMIFSNPRHPYTAGLLRAIPSMQISADRLTAISGQVPDASELPSGCHFAPRCSLVTARCLSEKPILSEIEPGHSSACFESHRVS